MNQILMVKKNKTIYIIVLYISLIIILISIILFIVYRLQLNNKELESKIILNNYSILQLYNTSSYNHISSEEKYSVIGIIEIPILNISYPIFSNISDELLKISPCRLSGTMPDSISNLCIAGHNYDNNKFFSNINKLNNNDSIFIYNNSMKQYSYVVIDKYEVENDDLSPLYIGNLQSPLLTLITCNNSNSKRIIVTAKRENF